MKTCTACGRTVPDDDGLELTDGSFYCRSGGCQKRMLDGVFEKEVIPDILRSGGRVVGMVGESESPQRSSAAVSGAAPAEFNQRCEVCHKVQVGGSRYSFYYGNKPKKDFADFLLQLRGIKQPPVFKDRGSAWICHKCTSRRSTLLHFLMAFFLVFGLLCIVLLIIDPSVSLLLAPILFLSMGIFVILYDKYRGDKEIPQRMAIKIRKGELKKQGYDVFLTDRQFAKLH